MSIPHWGVSGEWGTPLAATGTTQGLWALGRLTTGALGSDLLEMCLSENQSRLTRTTGD